MNGWGILPFMGQAAGCQTLGLDVGYAEMNDMLPALKKHAVQRGERWRTVRILSLFFFF